MRGLALASTAGLAAATAAALVVAGWSRGIGTAVAKRNAPVVRAASPAGVMAIDVGGVPTDLEATPDALWVSVGLGGIVRLDPRTNGFVARIHTGGSVTKLASGFGAVRALDLFGDRLLRFDPTTNRIVRSIEVDPLPSALALGHGLVWVSSQLASTVSGIDPTTGEVVKLARFAPGELWPGGLATGPEGVWVITGAGNEVSLFDPETMTFRYRTSVVGARSITRLRNGRMGRSRGPKLPGPDPERSCGSGRVRRLLGRLRTGDRVGPARVGRIRGRRRGDRYRTRCGRRPIPTPEPLRGRGDRRRRRLGRRRDPASGPAARPCPAP